MSFTSQKIEASQWPWATLMISEKKDQAAWIQQMTTIPLIYPEGAIGSNRDIHFHFKDSYVDLNDEVEHLSDLSNQGDLGIAPHQMTFL